MSNLLAMSLAGSAVVGLILLLRPVTVKIFPAKWQYRIGKMAIAFFLIPVSLLAVKLPLVQPAAIENYSSEPIIHAVSPANGFEHTIDAVIADAVIEKHLPVEVMRAILFIWLAGAIAFAAWHFYCYRRFTRQLRADNIPVPEDAEASALLSSCKAALGIHGVVKLVQNRKITSPMLVGLLHPMILLPTSNMQETDLKLVLTHELTHLKRKDLWVKMLALAAGTLHWFNPFAYVLRKDVNTWGELSCDEALASEMSREERKLYGEAILNTLDRHSGVETAFCSSLCESRKHIERRLTMLLNVKKTKKHIAVLAVAAILVIGASGVAVAAYAANNTPKLVEKSLSQDKDFGTAVESITESVTFSNSYGEIKSGEDVRFGGYALHKGDIVNLDYSFSGSNLKVSIFEYSDVSYLDGKTIENKSSYEIPKDGNYYFIIQNPTQNDKPSKDIEITIHVDLANDIHNLSKETKSIKSQEPLDKSKEQNQQPLPKAVSYGKLEILENTSMNFGVDSFSISSPNLAPNDYVTSSSSHYINSEVDKMQFSVNWSPMGQKIQVGFISKNDNSQQYWISNYVGGSASGTISTNNVPSGEYYAAISTPDSNTEKVHLTGNFEMKSEGVSGPISIDSAPATLISVKLSDERKFSPEEWQDILKKIERGEVTVEPEVDTASYAASEGIPVAEGKVYANLTRDGKIEAKGKELANYQFYTNSEEITVSIPKGEYKGEFVLYDALHKVNIQQFVLDGSKRTKKFTNLSAIDNYYIMASGIDDLVVTVSD